MSAGLTRIVSWAQQLLAEVLQPGDLAVDLTAGTGRDTLFLARHVAPDGRVLAFDIQRAALAQTAALLDGAGFGYTRHSAAVVAPLVGPGVHLLPLGHERFAEFLPAPPRVIIANLGYLPGGDPAITTLPDTTLTALRQALSALVPGGRLAVALYVAHPGGRSEADAVDALFAALPAAAWQVLCLSVANLPQAPFLLVAEKKHDAPPC